MPHYEFFCHACNNPFSKTLTPAEYKESTVTCPHCGSEEVEQRWFYAPEARQSVDNLP
jgi:putative FmdB family regulatory protein